MNEPLLKTASRTRVDRARVLRSRKEIEQFFKEKRWLTTRNSKVQAAYAIWPAEEGKDSLQFLFLVTKRNVPKAHDRNQLKRWLRAAVHEVGGFEAIAQQMQNENRRLILMLTISTSPEEIDWGVVLSDVRNIETALLKRALS